MGTENESRFTMYKVPFDLAKKYLSTVMSIVICLIGCCEEFAVRGLIIKDAKARLPQYTTFAGYHSPQYVFVVLVHKHRRAAVCRDNRGTTQLYDVESHGPKLYPPYV